MADLKQTPTVVGKIIERIRTYLWKLWYEKIAPLPPQPQRTQPATRQIQAAATPETIDTLGALEAALAGGGETTAIHTAFSTLSLAERQAHWHTQEPLSQADQMALWEQHMEELLAQYRTDPALADGLTFLRRLLRSHPDQPLETMAICAPAIYQTFLAEGNGDVIAFAQQIAHTNTPAEIAANQDLIVQLAGMFGQQTATRVLPYIHRLKAEQAERARASVLGTDLETSEEVIVSQLERQQGLYCIGVNGTGKTTLLASLIKKDLEQGLGLCLVEPHGDLTKTVLSLVPEHRLKDVIFLDVMDSAFPFGLNLFQSDLPGDTNEAAKTASFLMHLFEQIWNVGTETPRLQQVLRNITRTLLANPGMTFAEIPLLLWDDTVRQKLVSNVTTTQTQIFWQQYNTKSQHLKDEQTASTINKVDSYLNEPLIANLVSQANTSINFRQIMDESKILLIQLSPQLEEVSRLLGAAIIGRLLMAAFSRSDLAEDDRRQFNFYVDEFQRFATSDWRTFLEEARKFNVPITFAHQAISQLDESLQSAATGAGTIVVFRVSGEDSKVLARSFDATPTQELVRQEPVRSPVSEVIRHLINRGHGDPRVTAFAQGALTHLEQWIKQPNRLAFFPNWATYYDCPVEKRLLLTEHQVREGRELLNHSLYRCMVEKNPDYAIPPLAIYVLVAAQGDEREYILSPHIDSVLLDGFFIGPYHLRGFTQSAARFGKPEFTHPANAAAYIAAVPKKRQWMAERVVSLLTELRYCIRSLASEPAMVDTGQHQPVYRQRTYTDMGAQIANDLSQQENYIARVKTLTAEHTIRTHPLPRLLSEAQLAQRTREIKGRMQEQGLCRPAHEVEEEVRIRHERLRQRNDAPPPSHTNGTNRRRYRPRPPDHA